MGNSQSFVGIVLFQNTRIPDEAQSKYWNSVVKNLANAFFRINFESNKSFKL